VEGSRNGAKQHHTLGNEALLAHRQAQAALIRGQPSSLLSSVEHSAFHWVTSSQQHRVTRARRQSDERVVFGALCLSRGGLDET